MRGWLAAALVLTTGAAAANAQVIRVAGTIKDDVGRPVRGAAITAENPDQAPSRLTATSNAKGEFGFIGIRRGMWTLTVDAPGFERIQFRHSVTTGRQPPIDVRLAHTPAPVALPLDGIRATDIQQRIARAESLAAGGDVDAAIAAWTDVLAKVPALTSVYMQVGALYERKPDPARALASYRKLLELEPGNARAQAAVERLDTRR
jgi:tetratricopeptide (TPR) repeat protein